jgi:hypothetical protein
MYKRRVFVVLVVEKDQSINQLSQLHTVL